MQTNEKKMQNLKNTKQIMMKKKIWEKIIPKYKSKTEKCLGKGKKIENDIEMK